MPLSWCCRDHIWPNPPLQATAESGLRLSRSVELEEKPNEAGPKTETRDMTNRNQKRSTFG
jgi:hypothetical protein